MAVFGAEVEADINLISYVDDINQKLGTNTLMNCFKQSKVSIINKAVVGYFKPIYPNTPLIAFFVFTIPMLYFRGLEWTNWYAFSIICLLGSMLWTDTFIYCVFKFGARRKGYKGIFRRLSKESIVKELLIDGTKGDSGILKQ
jgi:hypothetical protein